MRCASSSRVDYDFAELDELAHAYAVTIHRSQGSEYPAVVIPVTTSSWMMLQRNLLYTGVTRAKQLIVLAGSRRALAQAVRTPGSGRRHTALTRVTGDVSACGCAVVGRPGQRRRAVPAVTTTFGCGEGC
jgi:exodeoxyribonuclease V alpha subunit